VLRDAVGRARHRSKIDRHGRRRVWPDGGEPLAIRRDSNPRHHPCQA
jgi:hypothetical protein